MTNIRLNVLIILVLVIGAGWIVLSRAETGSTTAGEIPAPQVGFLAPEFELLDVAGQNVRLSSYRGRPVLVNFWASWCSPCRSEMPAMEDAFQALQEDGIEILAVNSTFQDDAAAARLFVQENQLTFPILFDTGGEATRQYAVRALPTSFFIDRQGKIQDIVVGGPMSEALLRIRLFRLINEGAPTPEIP